jgi:hypothetical protein
VKVKAKYEVKKTPPSRRFVLPITYIQTPEGYRGNLKKQLMFTKPADGILALLDMVFDYLTIEDLEQVVKVCKFFFYVATLDKLFVKFCNASPCPKSSEK